ncbi:MAG: YcnI family protein [Candidatus Sericytochromatia bacterium]
MTRISRVLQRALTPVAVAAGLSTAAPAAAHVHVDADESEPGHNAVLTFRVPNKSENNSLTTGLTVAMPPNTAVMAEVVPGWTIRLDRDMAAGTVRSVTWIAAPGTGIGPNEFGLFRVSMKLPQSDEVSFPATQTYSDGSVVRWDQSPSPASGRDPQPEGGEPDHPAPTLALAAQDASGHGTRSQTDVPARWLGAAGVVVGAAGVTLALARRRA